MYCDFKDTGKVFKNKKIYRCSQCGLTISLEHPDAKIICFPFAREVLGRSMSEDTSNPIPQDLIVNNDKEADVLIQKMYQNDKILGPNPTTKTDDKIQHSISDPAMCTQEQIEERLAICNKCDYYKNDSCLLCGCAIVREKNYKNKLANANAQCPDGRWGPV